MKYKMIAIDVDGTLVGSDNIVCGQNVDALTAAAAAGMDICLASGGSMVETMPVWRQLSLPQPPGPLIVLGGARIAEPLTGRTLYHKPMPKSLACQYADALADEGYAAMAIVDPWRYGVDYFFAETGDSQTAINKWFSQMDVKVRRVARLADAPEMPDPLRVSAVVEPDQADELASRLAERFGDDLNVHAIFAPNYQVTIVEAFASGAGKWNAVKYLAQAGQISADRIVAVGDDINDLPMIQAARLGVAIADNRPALEAAADHGARDGLAKFIGQLLAGNFDN